MFLDWPEHTAHVKKSFGSLGKTHPKMLQAYLALNDAASACTEIQLSQRVVIATAIDINSRVLISNASAAAASLSAK